MDTNTLNWQFNPQQRTITDTGTGEVLADVRPGTPSEFAVLIAQAPVVTPTSRSAVNRCGFRTQCLFTS